MASAKIILFTSKKLKDGEHPVMLRIIHGRATKYLNLKINCHPDFWDAQKQVLKKKHPAYHEFSVLINKRLLEAERIILELESEGRAYSADEIIERLTVEKRRRQTTVLAFFDEIINRMRSKERIGYAAVFASTRNYLRNFRRGKDFHFSDISPSFLSKFDEYLITERGMKPNSAFVPMRTFKTLLNYAKKEDLVKQDYDPFKDFSFTKYRKDKPAKRAICREDIRKIEALELQPGSFLCHARNIFVFSYYCAGINFIDIAHLTWENVKGARLQYIRKKTKEAYDIKLLPPAQTILEYFQKHCPCPVGYVFPILSEAHQTAMSKENRIDKLLKMVNKALKEIAALAGLDIHLTTYVARHSFATNLKHKGISTAIISQALGHDSEKTTQAYLASFEDAIMDEAMGAIL